MLSFRTKSEWIIALDKDGLSTKEIAAIVGCLPEYVRVVARQRKGSGQSKNDRRYLQSSLGKITQKKRDKRDRPAKYAYAKIVEETGNRDAANAVAREVHKAARLAGKSFREAKIAAISARNSVMLRTGDGERARKAARELRKSNQPTEAIHEHA